MCRSNRETSQFDPPGRREIENLFWVRLGDLRDLPIGTIRMKAVAVGATCLPRKTRSSRRRTPSLVKATGKGLASVVSVSSQENHSDFKNMQCTRDSQLDLTRRKIILKRIFQQY